jgi:hypothetical protein
LEVFKFQEESILVYAFFLQDFTNEAMSIAAKVYFLILKEGSQPDILLDQCIDFVF